MSISAVPETISSISETAFSDFGVIELIRKHYESTDAWSYIAVFWNGDEHSPELEFLKLQAHPRPHTRLRDFLDENTGESKPCKFIWGISRFGNRPFGELLKQWPFDIGNMKPVDLLKHMAANALDSIPDMHYLPGGETQYIRKKQAKAQTGPRLIYVSDAHAPSAPLP